MTYEQHLEHVAKAAAYNSTGFMVDTASLRVVLHKMGEYAETLLKLELLARKHEVCISLDHGVWCASTGTATGTGGSILEALESLEREVNGGC